MRERGRGSSGEGEKGNGEREGKGRPIAYLLIVTTVFIPISQVVTLRLRSTVLYLPTTPMHKATSSSVRERLSLSIGLMKMAGGLALLAVLRAGSLDLMLRYILHLCIWSV